LKRPATRDVYERGTASDAGRGWCAPEGAVLGARALCRRAGQGARSEMASRRRSPAVECRSGGAAGAAAAACPVRL